MLQEFAAAEFAVTSTQLSVQANPTILPFRPHEVKPSHLRDCLTNLSNTYTLRLFAEFEGALRDYWATERTARRLRRTTAETLLDRVAARLRMPSHAITKVHAVREHRNAIAHHSRSKSGLDFDSCKSSLAKYVSYLPLSW